MRSPTRIVVLTAAAVAFATGASAQSTQPTTALDVQSFWPSAGPSQSFSLPSSDVQPHLAVGFGLLGNFANHPLVFTDNVTGATHNVVNYALTTDFLWSLGLFNRFQLSAAIPLVVAQDGEGASVLGNASGSMANVLPQTALRDFRFDLAFAIVQRARRSDASGFGLRVDAGGTIPVGDYGNFQGVPDFTFVPAVIADYRVAGLTVVANVGARIRPTYGVADVAFGSQLLAAIGIGYRPLGFDRLMVGVDYTMLVPLTGALTVTTVGLPSQTYEPFTPMELFFGAHFAVDKARDIEVTLGGGAPLDSAPTVPQFRVIAGIAYWPRGYDSDGDGVPDASDRCINVAEDRDGFEDDDGCPDPDNDGDHIADTEDRCPNQPEDVDNFEDADGCPDTDNDHDGVPDPDDECALESSGDHPDPAHPGCPMRDRDGDGVLDTQDRCPEQPAGDRPDPARPGCPLPDRDHDGVPDADDACPSDPSGEHPDAFRPGCPDPDRDHDGVPNETDRCPDQPETINGVTDDDGCPDEGPEATHWAGNVIIFERAIHLAAGTRRLTPALDAVLAQAARRIRGRGDGVEHVLVQVVPAPGPRGRVEAVRLAGLAADALVAHGVVRERVSADAVPPPEPSAPAEGQGVMHAGRPPQPGRFPPASIGELRIRIVPRALPAHRVPAPRVMPAGIAPAASVAPSASPSPAPAASASPAPASSAAPIVAP